MPGRPPAFLASRLGRVTPRNADDPVAKRVVIPIATLALVFYLTVEATVSRTV